MESNVNNEQFDKKRIESEKCPTVFMTDRMEYAITAQQMCETANDSVSTILDSPTTLEMPFFSSDDADDLT